jgi:hypothetical protein
MVDDDGGDAGDANYDGPVSDNTGDDVWGDGDDA